ncbi:PAS domain S-box protein [Leptolyngbya sp. AN03gr2]|uniref:PAS domain S-box protein n=1 Tax=unclassified Leptolyngbya TaxID=2650499 RepID=UPI003D319EDC
MSEHIHPSLNGHSSINSSPKSNLADPHSIESGAVSAVGMVLQLADGQIAACNANAERMMGMSAAEMTGWRSTNPNWRVVREDGSPFPGHEHPAMVALTTGKPCRDVIMGFYQPTGALVWLLLNSQPLFQGDSNQPYAVLTTLTEVPQADRPNQSRISQNGTATKPSTPPFKVQSALGLLAAENQALRDREERLRLALEGADLGLWDYDLEARQFVWSNRCKVLFGVPLNAVMSYDRFLEAVHSEDRDRINAEIHQVIQSSTDYDLEIRLQQSAPDLDHAPRWIRLKGNVYRNSDGQPHRMVGIAIDITHQKWTQQNLAQSQAEFEAFMDNSPALAFIKDDDGRVVYMNAIGERLFDQLPLNKTDFDYLPNDIATEIYEHDRQVLQTGETIRVIETAPDVSGESRSWLVVKFPLPMRDGKRLLGGMGIEITEQRQAEAQLRDSQQFIQQIADTVPGMLYVYDVLERRNVYINQRVEDILGYSPATIQSFGSELFNYLMHPDDLAGLPQHYAKFTVSQPGTVHEYECRLRNAAGQWQWFLCRDLVFRTTEDGQLWQLLGSTEDITDRKRIEEQLRHSEDRYRCLAECIPQLIWTADTDGNLNDINQRWSNYTGLTLEQAQGAGWIETLHPDDVGALLEAWKTAQQQQSFYQAEARMRSTTGEYRWFLIKAMPIRDDDGQVLKWYGTATDIEDQKQLALERLRALEFEHAARTEAEKANRTKDELLMTLSHELRTPLNPILGWCRLLQTREFSQEQSLEAIATIERSARRQLQLVNDLIDMAKLLNGAIQLKPGLVDLPLLIESAIAAIKPTAQAKGIQIQRSIDPDLRAFQGDPARLQQIVWNLLSNAIKFTPAGGKVTVQLDRTEHALRLQVSDTGAGIDTTVLPYIFERFRQSDSSSTRNYGGLGLGLTIVRYLVELHGGTIEAKSLGRDRGATFTIELPWQEILSDR